MIKVVHVITDLERGGAETVLFRFLQYQCDNLNYQHVVISLKDRGFYAPKIEELGIEVYSLNFSGLTRFPSAFWSLISLIRQLKPDLVQTWLYHADLLGGLAARCAGISSVIWGIHTVHLDLKSSRATRIVRKLCAWTSSLLPTLIVCVAEAARKTHVALGYDERRLTVIPNGFDLPEQDAHWKAAQALRASLNFGAEDSVIGCIGRFHPDKDYQTFLKAAAMLKDRYPKARFLLVGRELTKNNPELFAWIKATKLGEQVAAIGERNDIGVCLLAMDVFCLPSKTEAFPLVLGEAMAMSRPCVTTDVGDAALLVGLTGIVVQPHDPSGLAKGLADMLAKPVSERVALGQAARNRIEVEYSMSAMLSRTLQSYELVLARRHLHGQSVR